ncbi:MAG TPA: S24 family peptidase [Sulfuricaulis sp.]|jgi:SOS-response transcriptional repressor LexA|nr:S24 family peptidase [Sulfuricaulis sp.]
MPDQLKFIPIVSAGAARENLEIKSCAEAEPYALRVIGDSMAPEFLDGHIIVVDPVMSPRDGAFVVIDYRGETLFRQFMVKHDKKLLKALNEAYPTVEMEENYRVRGVVIQRAGRRRADHKHYG